MGWLKKVRDAHDAVRQVDEQMDKVQAHIDRGGPRVSAKEHARLNDAAEAALARRRAAIRGGGR